MDPALDNHGIEYRHFEALGGRRSAPPADSPDNEWENVSFQAYADYALTNEFQTALDEEFPLAVMTPGVGFTALFEWLDVTGVDRFG